MFTQIFDTHSHYTDSAFDADRHEVLSALPETGIVHAVLAGTTLEDSTAGIALADRYDDVVVNDDLDRATDELVRVLDMHERN